MGVDQKNAEKVLNKIRISKNINIVPSSPVDGDALGSGLALKRILEKLGKNATINYSFEHISRFKFLPGFEFINVLDIYNLDLSKYDASIFLDGGSLVQFYDQATHPERLVLPIDNEIVNIDHHLTNEGFAGITLRRLDVSSTAEIIYDLFKDQIEFDSEIGFNLLAGISTDTGNFRYSNSTAKTLMIAADLIDRGVDLAKVALNLYYTTNEKVVKFVGYLCQKIVINRKYRYGYFTVTNKEWEGSGLGYENYREAYHKALEGNLKLIEEIDFAFNVTEKEPGNVKISFRSRESGKVDLLAIAQSLGGGGHPDACGANILNHTVENVLELVEKSVEDNYDRIIIK
jgi:phosphoesterase RecJ-like protein